MGMPVGFSLFFSSRPRRISSAVSRSADWFRLDGGAVVDPGVFLSLWMRKWVAANSNIMDHTTPNTKMIKYPSFRPGVRVIFILNFPFT